MRLACDTGGTFTDLVVEDDAGALHMFKAPTTPREPVQGILDAIDVAALRLAPSRAALLGQAETFIHGTTHAINAIITGRTAKTAFLTTRGHPDVLVLREGGRIEPFNFNHAFPEPYIPKALTFEVGGRIGADGQVVEALDRADLLTTIARLKALQVEAVAVCLLWSTVNGEHEDIVGALLEQHLPGVPFTLSHVLNPILREYRRASSAAIDASLKPLMSRYVAGLSARLAECGFRGRLLMLTSKGGVMDCAALADAPIHAIGSGPSMAPIAGRHFARVDSAAETAIIADTGGTTYDVSLVRRGVIPMTPESWIGQRYRGHIVGFPSVDVKSVGAGGGSIAWVDAGGLLHVGPDSAGAEPGPACYGKGGSRATVTDAALVLGFIDPDFFLGGAMALDPAKAEAALMADVGGPLGLEAAPAASAVLRLMTESMVAAIEQITVHQGLDPRGTVLVGGGGAAGLNSVAIARRLGCAQVLIPELGAALSATGALISDLHADFRTVFFTATGDFDVAGVNAALAALTAKCRAFIKGPGAGAVSHAIEYFAEARYRAQVWEIDLPLPAGQFGGADDVAAVRAAFDRLHEDVFAFNDPGSEVEFVGWRAVARGKLSRRALGTLGIDTAAAIAAGASRPVFFGEGQRIDTPVHLFAALPPEVPIEGPAIIESPFTTIVVDPGARAVRTAAGSLLIEP